jgi:uncharacterized membrane protein
MVVLHMQIVTRGMYAVTAMYTSRFHGPRPEFILAVGQWKDIVAGTAPNLTNTLGVKVISITLYSTWVSSKQADMAVAIYPESVAGEVFHAILSLLLLLFCPQTPPL